MELYRHISAHPQQNGPELATKASQLYGEVREKCQGDEAQRSLVLDLEGTGEAQLSSHGHGTACMSAIGADVHSGITDVFQRKATIQGRAEADDEGMMDESA